MSLLWLGCSALLAATSTQIQKLIQPRLPEYEFRVTKLPWFLYQTGHLQVPSHVYLYNDNLIPVNVHAMSFDLYYPKWDGSSLIHIGQVIDRQQQQQFVSEQQNKTPCYYYHGGMLKCEDDEDDDDELDFEALMMINNNGSPQPKERLSSSMAAAAASIMGGPKKARPPPVLWSLPARAAFSSHDEIFLAKSTVSSWFTIFYHAVGQMIWRMLYHGTGTVYIPSTGVLYVKEANTRTPLTMSIVCDNMLQTFTMELRGLECSLHNMDVGWWPLEPQVLELRHLALHEWIPQNKTTGSIVQRKKKKKEKENTKDTKQQQQQQQQQHQRDQSKDKKTKKDPPKEKSSS